MTDNQGTSSIGAILENLKKMVEKVFDIKTDDMSGIMVMTTIAPLMVEVMKDPIMKSAVLSDVLTDDLQIAIAKYDSFVMTRNMKSTMMKNIAK